MSNENIYLISQIIVVIGVFIITFIKKSKQMGKNRDERLSSTVNIQGKDLLCAHCGHNQFKKREGLLTTTWMTLFRMAFWNQSARCYVCTDCGNLHWFLSPNERAEIQRDSND
ncbi:MAG TPA: hypothetical protein VGP47_02860 [Parachlamydiaceae bacterium]|nr:hypothetical protein [Parachlamydiaceae bacterium]